MKEIPGSGYPGGEADHKLGMLDPPQPLGMLPSRRFWTNRDNQQLVQRPHAILVGVLLLVIGMLELSWWTAALSALAMLFLLAGLLERAMREAAKQRVAPHHH
jgi:hypothetical protein